MEQESCIEYEVTALTVAVTLTDTQWLRLMDNECKYTKGEIPRHQYLVGLLEREGAENVEFNGHFGQFVYYTCEDREALARINRKLTDSLA